MSILFRNVVFGLLALQLNGCESSEGRIDNSSGEQTEPQEVRVGGRFENADLFYVDMPEQIEAVDTSPGWSQSGVRVHLDGMVFKRDGKTPAPKVILYYYHTDVNGKYQEVDKPGGRTKHGYIRGWVKTDSVGRFSIYTVRPKSYPNSQIPAHIHVSIKEPNNLSTYYLDEVVFDDDPFVDTAYIKNSQNRGGSGVLHIQPGDGIQKAIYNIILGLNVPDYPE